MHCTDGLMPATDTESTADSQLNDVTMDETEGLPVANPSLKETLSTEMLHRSSKGIKEWVRQRPFKHRNRRVQLKLLDDGMTQYFKSDEGKRNRIKISDKKLDPTTTNNSEASSPNITSNAKRIRKSRMNRLRRIGAKLQKKASLKRRERRPKKLIMSMIKREILLTQEHGTPQVTSNAFCQTRVNEDILFPHITDEDMRWFIMAQAVARQRHEQSAFHNETDPVSLDLNPVSMPVATDSNPPNDVVNEIQSEDIVGLKRCEVTQGTSPTRQLRMYFLDNIERNEETKPKSKCGWPKGRKRGPRLFNKNPSVETEDDFKRVTVETATAVIHTTMLKLRRDTRLRRLIAANEATVRKIKTKRKRKEKTEVNILPVTSVTSESENIDKHLVENNFTPKKGSGSQKVDSERKIDQTQCNKQCNINAVAVGDLVENTFERSFRNASELENLVSDAKAVIVQCQNVTYSNSQLKLAEKRGREHSETVSLGNIITPQKPKRIRNRKVHNMQSDVSLTVEAAKTWRRWSDIENSASFYNINDAQQCSSAASNLRNKVDLVLAGAKKKRCSSKSKKTSEVDKSTNGDLTVPTKKVGWPKGKKRGPRKFCRKKIADDRASKSVNHSANETTSEHSFMEKTAIKENMFNLPHAGTFLKTVSASPTCSESLNIPQATTIHKTSELHQYMTLTDHFNMGADENPAPGTIVSRHTLLQSLLLRAPSPTYATSLTGTSHFLPQSQTIGFADLLGNSSSKFGGLDAVHNSAHENSTRLDSSFRAHIISDQSGIFSAHPTAVSVKIQPGLPTSSYFDTSYAMQDHNRLPVIPSSSNAVHPISSTNQLKYFYSDSDTAHNHSPSEDNAPHPFAEFPSHRIFSQLPVTSSDERPPQHQQYLHNRPQHSANMPFDYSGVQFSTDYHSPRCQPSEYHPQPGLSNNFLSGDRYPAYLPPSFQTPQYTNLSKPTSMDYAMQTAVHNASATYGTIPLFADDHKNGRLSVLTPNSSIVSQPSDSPRLYSHAPPSSMSSPENISQPCIIICPVRSPEEGGRVPSVQLPPNGGLNSGVRIFQATPEFINQILRSQSQEGQWLIPMSDDHSGSLH